MFYYYIYCYICLGIKTLLIKRKGNKLSAYITHITICIIGTIALAHLTIAKQPAIVELYKKGKRMKYQIICRILIVLVGMMITVAGHVEAATVDVSFTDTGFSPSNISAIVGDTVRWTNTTAATFVEIASDPHPVHTFYPALNLGILAPGESKTLVFGEIGAYTYHNHLHPDTGGTIIIRQSTDPIEVTGDLNGDRVVDIFDYNILLGNFGTVGSPNFTPADIDGNGAVDIFDYNILLGNFGAHG